MSGRLTADAIGPIVEFSQLVGIGGLERLRSANWFNEGTRRPFLDAITGAAENWIASDRSCGFARGCALQEEERLNGFKIDAHKAALGAGFGKATSFLIAAIGELIGNIEDHSEAKHTGLAAFLSRGNCFEFVVTDRGIGGLASLRKCDDYAKLLDDGAALVEMIETGVSRFGRGLGHGNGFRPIFEKLADMTGQLRFRSGDHALSLEGRFGNRIGRQLAQKPRITGFFAGVVCGVPRER